MDDLSVRDVQPGDAEAAARLVTELGYSTSTEEMTERLRQLLKHADYKTFVAERSGQVVGMVGVCLSRTLVFDEVYGRLTGLAVDDGSQDDDVRERLMEHLEQWLEAHGTTLVTLTSATYRTDSHRFYRELGYAQTGVRLVKRL